MENPQDLIEFFPAVAFRDPPNDVEKCPPAYRRVVGRASRQRALAMVSGRVWGRNAQGMAGRGVAR